MRKHQELKHPGKDFKWKHILTGGQSNLLAMLHVPGRAIHVDKSIPEVGKDDNMKEVFVEGEEVGLDDADAVLNPSRKRFCSGEAKNQEGGEDKKEANTHDVIEKKDIGESSVVGILSDLKEVASSMTIVKDSFTELLSNFGGLFVNKGIDESLEEALVQANDDSSVLFACKDFKQLMQVVEERGFDYDEELGLVGCVLCNQTKAARNIRLRDSKVGVFGFDLAAYRAALIVEPHKQPRLFLNLKRNIAKHERESQVHRSLVHQSAAEERAKQIRQSRNEEIGLNLFRIRYN